MLYSAKLKGWGLFFLSTLFAPHSWTAPFNPQPFMVANGADSIAIQQYGDEHYFYTQTTDGFLVEKSVDGVFYYLDQNAHVSPVMVRNAENRSNSDSLFLNGIDQRLCREAHLKLHPLKHLRPDADAQPRKADWVPSIGNPIPSGVPSVRHMPTGHPHTSGTNRFPIILVAGTSIANSDSAELWKRFNLQGYNGDRHYGSVRDYYIDQSNGLFVPSFDIYVVNVNLRLPDYAGNEGAVIAEAITQLRRKYSNFNASLYDADHDGKIDAFGVLYAGTQGQNNNLGGFAYELRWNKEGEQNAGDNIKFNRYFMLWQNNDYRTLIDIGHLIHEFSHTMGLKDHYSVRNNPTSFTTQFPGVHSWDVMAGGMFYNGGGTPCGYSAFEKEFMGWIQTKTLVQSDKTVAIGDFSSTNLAYKVPVNNDEFFILENRQLVGWDMGLPNHGMLIWHIDYDEKAWNDDVLNDTENHQRIDIVEAGNLAVTSYGDGLTSTHLRDDPYPGSQNVTSFSRFVSWNGKDLGIKLYQITEKNQTIYFNTQDNVPLDTNVLPDDGSEPVIRDTVYFEFGVDLPISESYAGVAFDISSVFDSLGVSGIAESAYANGSLRLYGVDADGSYRSGSTAIDPGHWFNAGGNVSAYADGFVYSELKLNKQIDTVGHYPGKVSAGDVFSISQALEYGNRVAQYCIKVSIVGDATDAEALGSDNIVCSATRNNLELKGMPEGEKVLKLYGVNGQLLSFNKLRGRDASVPLNKGTGFFIVVLEHGNKTVFTKRMEVR